MDELPKMYEEPKANERMLKILKDIQNTNSNYKIALHTHWRMILKFKKKKTITKSLQESGKKNGTLNIAGGHIKWQSEN